MVELIRYCAGCNCSLRACEFGLENGSKGCCPECNHIHVELKDLQAWAGELAKKLRRSQEITITDERELGLKNEVATELERVAGGDKETLEEHDKHCKLCQGLGYGKKTGSKV